MKKHFKEVVLVSALTLATVLAVAKDLPRTEETQAEVQEEVQEEVQFEVQEEIQVGSEAVTQEEVIESAPPKIQFYDVPLAEEIQLHIFKECEKHNIAPTIILAMIERESRFTIDAVGDSGDSLGLMQIQPKWHKERMNRLGCNNLLDPYQNITVGADLVAELKAENDDIYWVLMAYNKGYAYANKMIASGQYSDYAVTIVQRAAEIGVIE